LVAVKLSVAINASLVTVPGAKMAAANVAVPPEALNPYTCVNGEPAYETLEYVTLLVS